MSLLAETVGLALSDCQSKFKELLFVSMKKLWKKFKSVFAMSHATVFNMGVFWMAIFSALNIAAWTKNWNAAAAVFNLLLFINCLHMDYWRRKDEDTRIWMEIDYRKFRTQTEMFTEFMNRGKMTSRPPNQDDPIH